jgi:hypothetical protein
MPQGPRAGQAACPGPLELPFAWRNPRYGRVKPKLPLRGRASRCMSRKRSTLVLPCPLAEGRRAREFAAYSTRTADVGSTSKDDQPAKDDTRDSALPVPAAPDPWRRPLAAHGPPCRAEPQSHSRSGVAALRSETDRRQPGGPKFSLAHVPTYCHESTTVLSANVSIIFLSSA